jgi:hypothetical protein
MSISSFVFALVTTALAVAFIGLDHEIWAFALAPAAAWFAFLTFARDEAEDRKYVLTLGGVRWSEADFCRGWEIDGRTGSGKTASGVVPIIHALKLNRPEVGILALDTKGDLSEPLNAIAGELGREPDIRQLEATTINSTQSPTSYIPPMGSREKADVFLLNLGNKIYFTAADKQSSEMIADSIGKHTIKKRTYGWSGGKRNTSWTEQDEHLIKPHVLRTLPKHRAIIKHCERAYRKVFLPPSQFTKIKSHQPQ